MQWVTITYNEEKKIISVSFAENLESFLVLFPDTQYLMNNCIEQKGNLIHLSKEIFQNFIDYHRTIPMLVTVKIEENLQRVEYAFNYILDVLQRELSEECKQIEELHSLQQEEEYKELSKKADERIWYLRIKKISEGPYGYERNITEEINGSLVTYPEFISNVNSLNKFEISFNNIKFETLLYPYFDGSRDIIIPIRGVNHELCSENDSSQTDDEMTVQGSYTSISTTANRPHKQWAIVFTTEEYNQAGFDDAKWAVHAGYCFIFGEHSNGVYDYGWSVMYCMDGSESNLPTKTCEETDDDYLEDMLADVNSILGDDDKLIVFAHGHGKWKTQHHTMTTKARYWVLTFSNTIKDSEYNNLVGDITLGGTYVFLWVACCHGNSLRSWSSSDHNDHLEVWCYDPAGRQIACTAIYYYDVYWQFKHSTCDDSEGYLFFYNAQLLYAKHITSLGIDIKDNFNELYSDEMYTTTFWGAKRFYV